MNSQINRIWDALRKVQNAHGSVITDYSCAKSWDPGQAICRHMFGPQWMKDDDFKAMDKLDELPDEYFEAATELAESKPNWLVAPEEPTRESND